MGKTEVIVDTCFLQKVSSEGKEIDNIKKTEIAQKIVDLKRMEQEEMYYD